MMQTEPQAALSSERGVGVIEALCAVTIIAIAIAGSLSLYMNTIRHLATARAYAGVSADVDLIVEGLRNETYTTLLNRYNKPFTSIANGETVSVTAATNETHGEYEVTLTAIKTLSESAPEAVRVDIEANQHGAKSGTLNFNFSTMIAHAE